METTALWVPVGNEGRQGGSSNVPWSFSDPDKALGQSAAPRWFLSVSVLSNSLYFTRGALGPSRARSTGRASVALVSGLVRATEPFPLL